MSEICLICKICIEHLLRIKGTKNESALHIQVKVGFFKTDEATAGCLSAAEKVWLEFHRSVLVLNLHQNLKDVQSHEDHI